MQYSQKLKTRLEVATNIAVLLAAVAVLITFAWNVYRARQPSPQLRPGLQKGVTLGPLRGLNYSDSPRTLVVTMNTHCGYCAASVPFYNRLAELERGNGKALRVVSVFPNSDDEVREYASLTQLHLDTIAMADFAALNLAGTPTLILVDEGGKVLDFWVGQLSEDAEQHVLERSGR
jgi:thiol-disulfide isomerase/thioredoxin